MLELLERSATTQPEKWLPAAKPIVALKKRDDDCETMVMRLDARPIDLMTPPGERSDFWRTR